MANSLILADYIGRLGNRLFLFIHVLAVAMEFRFRVFNLTLQPFATWFENLSRNSWCRYPAPTRGFSLHRWVRGARAAVEVLAQRQIKQGNAGRMGIRTIALQSEEHMAMERPEFLEICQNHRWIILWGWFFRADSYLERHQAAIRRFLRLKPGLDPALENELEKGSQEYDWQIALHIRQRDFRTWEGGRHYIPPSVFARHAERIRQANHEKKIRFWVCSDEPVDLSLFPLGTRTSFGQTLREDLRILTFCSFVLSGNSTLARVGAFLGGSRLHNLSLQAEPSSDPRNWQESWKALTENSS